MRNPVAWLFVSLAYAFASDRDYRDAERVARLAAAMRADRACWAPGAPCDRQAEWRLAVKR